MKILTAIGNEKINNKIKEKNIAEIIGQDIQYQEAVIDMLEKNPEIDLLILNSILPGEYNIYELINIIKYKNKKIKIIIFLENKEEKIIEFLVTKGITDIYINNEITIQEIINKIIKLKNPEKIIEENTIIKKTENKKNKLKINKKNKTKKLFKIKKINNNKKIITIIGAEKIGKSIFCLLLSLNEKNKKILIIDFNLKNDDMKIMIGQKIKEEKNIEFIKVTWKKNIDIIFIKKEIKEKENQSYKKTIFQILEQQKQNYDYIIIELGEIKRKSKNIRRIFRNCNFGGTKYSRDKRNKKNIKRSVKKTKKPKRQNQNCF